MICRSVQHAGSYLTGSQRWLLCFSLILSTLHADISPTLIFDTSISFDRFCCEPITKYSFFDSFNFKQFWCIHLLISAIHFSSVATALEVFGGSKAIYSQVVCYIIITTDLSQSSLVYVGKPNGPHHGISSYLIEFH